MRINQPPSKNFLQYASRLKIWQPVVRDGWVIKFSQYRDMFLLLTIVSQHTGQTILRYFNNEDEACAFINMVLCLDAFDYQEML